MLLCAEVEEGVEDVDDKEKKMKTKNKEVKTKKNKKKISESEDAFYTIEVSPGSGHSVYDGTFIGEYEMGCNVSTKFTKQGDEQEVDHFLTAEEIKIVRESWAIVALDLPATGLHIFTRLFEIEKDLKKLFRRLMSQTESGEFIFDSVRLERHATLVMKNLGQAVDNLDDSAYFSEMLTSLGEKHCAYNVKPEMLPFLWPAIRDGLRMRLGDKFGVESELAWKHLYDYISCKMTEGMDKTRTKNKRVNMHS